MVWRAELVNTPLAMPLPGDPIWADENQPRPRFNGEYIWLEVSPVARLARIELIYANYSADVTLLDMETMEFAERLERVPYGQLRRLGEGRLLHTPDLTKPARDAAVAELQRKHAEEESAFAARKSAGVAARQCKCSVGSEFYRLGLHFDLGLQLGRSGGLVALQMRPALPMPACKPNPGHNQLRCPIGIFEAEHSNRAGKGRSERNEQMQRLRDMCSYVERGGREQRDKVPIAHPLPSGPRTRLGPIRWATVTTDELAELLESMACSPVVVSYIRSFLPACKRQEQLRDHLFVADKQNGLEIARLLGDSGMLERMSALSLTAVGVGRRPSLTYMYS